jgi:hypothetical protein
MQFRAFDNLGQDFKMMVKFKVSNRVSLEPGLILFILPHFFRAVEPGVTSLRRR